MLSSFFIVFSNYVILSICTHLSNLRKISSRELSYTLKRIIKHFYTKYSNFEQNCANPEKSRHAPDFNIEVL